MNISTFLPLAYFFDTFFFNQMKSIRVLYTLYLYSFCCFVARKMSINLFVSSYESDVIWILIKVFYTEVGIKYYKNYIILHDKNVLYLGWPSAWFFRGLSSIFEICPLSSERFNLSSILVKMSSISKILSLYTSSYRLKCRTKKNVDTKSENWDRNFFVLYIFWKYLVTLFIFK